MKRILMVEDDEFLNKVYEAKLAEENFETYHVFRGDEVMRQVIEVKPDLIVLDLILPGKNGFEVLKELKRNIKTKKIPVIVLTNLSESSDKEVIMKLGAKIFAVKSNLSIDEVVGLIKVELSS